MALTDGVRREEDLALSAATLWYERTAVRERQVTALDTRQYTGADDPERLAKWVQRRRAWCAAIGGRADEEPPRAVRKEDVTDDLIERLVGETRDLLSVEFFALGLRAARCVGRVVTNGEANGSGFLVAPLLMLTNHHVLPSAASAAESEFELDFEEHRRTPGTPVQVFGLRPDVFYLADASLDFALVGVEATSRTDAPLDPYEWLPLIGEEGKVRVGEPVNIVQHPRGGAKQVSLRHNRLVDLPADGHADAFFHYETDTEKGSSGSPVFNDLWEVVAVHHTGVPKTNAAGELVDAQGQVLAERDVARYVWVANEGIRVSRIVAAVEAASLPPEMRTVRSEALGVWRQQSDPDAELATAMAAAGVSQERSGEEVESLSDGYEVEANEGAAAIELMVPLRIRVTIDPVRPRR